MPDGQPASHPLLDGHEAIAWDLDLTLFDCVHAPFFRQYIESRRDVRHHVVTHRTQPGAVRTEAQMAEHGFPPSLFEAIHYCPPELRAACDAHMYAGSGPTEAYRSFLEWKGAKASELGCGVLVDDNRDLVILGCERHGVGWVNSWDRGFPRDPEDEYDAPTL